MYIPYEIDEIAELTATGIMGWTLDKEYGFWETGDGDLDVESEWNPATVEKDADKLLNKVIKDKNLRFAVFPSMVNPKVMQATFATHTFEQANEIGEAWYDAFDTNPYKAMCKAALMVYGLELK